ncbi:hypothetical protein NP493_123g01000 [Ridgeia piscesae]|uniref:NADH dehydrogenase [ubiquinone] 1 beta subcomplex subunit 2, mitochondrial n=1 Tax=Ridgeia piscesae TaxID=27915 RepID=A0AAD9P5Y3_RIDPI|nr:hypothetical protein NP493_123g01000 [Ridgeia piscesae]
MSVFASLRNAPKLLATRNVRRVIPIRRSHDDVWTYRQPVKKPGKVPTIMAETLMAGMWYWMFYHLWYEWGHMVGHFDYPDPSKWTDAELGIPSDSDE